ncbi:MAG: anti-sigma factor, partial [Cyanobacteriota bacterium]|nr:anti-sigma factor [Cyanobacteriota bacterium]
FPKTLPDFRGAKSNHLGWIVGAIAVFVTLVLGIENVRLRQQLAQIQFNPNREIISLLRQPNNRLMTLKGLEEVSTASGSLFIVPQRNKAVLVLQNLTPLNGTDVYQLWAVSQNKKTGCISFVPNQNGMVYVELSQENLKNANSVLVTIEPKPDVSQPTGTPVIESIQSL